MLRWSNIFLGGLLLWLTGCVDPFEPEVVSSPDQYLVVDGTINLAGVTTIRLSKTQNIAATAPPPVETRATVSIKDNLGATYPLTEQAAGTYASQSLSLNPNRQYQLQVRTAANRRYASDLVAGKVAPPIDSVTWAVENQGVRVYVNTRDPANNTRYYRWKYEETWQFTSAFRSTIEFVNGAVRPRTNNIYECWGSQRSNAIQLSNSTRLGQDVIANFPLILLPRASVKLRIKYSVLVSQYAQTPEEYNYWELLKKNTESLGSLFDPQPTQLTGNVHCLDDANERVIGYVGATTITQKRIFIDNAELRSSFFYDTGNEGCSTAPDTIPLRIATDIFRNPNNVPIEPDYMPGTLNVIGYLISSADCVDCRRRGTNVKPSFWP